VTGVDEHESLFEQFEQFYNGSRDNGALDGKTKALIGLAVVLTGNCQP
jgi:alkylhydroperoxidase/carboxymuconolactone decarboxylase family protein YurZ